MIEGKRVLGVIAGRGGSVGLPRKNVLDLGGRPVIAWSVAAARQSALLDRTIVSTDDDEIAETAKAWGADVPFMRPPALATADAAIDGAIIHALDSLGEPFDYVVLLQASSPLRTGEDIDATIRLCHSHGSNTALTVAPAPKPPQWMYTVGEPDPVIRPLMPDFHGINRRQVCERAYTLNGAVYVARVDWFRTHRQFVDETVRAHVMAPERSVDIDGALDLVFARAIVAEFKLA